MKVVLQRVSEASVDVVNELGTLDPTFEPQQIGPGFMILVGVTDEDGDKQIAWLAHKILNLRVFEDAQGKMNRSIPDIGGEILSISQFAHMRVGLVNDGPVTIVIDTETDMPDGSR